MSLVRPAAMLACAMLLGLAPAQAQTQLRCGPFNPFAAAPAPRKEPAAQQSFERINHAVKTQPYRVLFFGDSITVNVSPIIATSVAKCGLFGKGLFGC